MPRRRSTEKKKLLNNGVPCISEMQQIFGDPEFAFQYLLVKGVLSVPVCPTCSEPCARRATSYDYRCRPCSYGISILKGTIFGGCRLGLHVLLCLMYYWCMRSTVSATRKATDISHATVSRWFCNLRLLASCMIRYSDQRIGGPGKIVEIDESKFGKRKKCRNRRGHRVDGVWVFGGIEQHGNAQYGNNKYFALCVPDRTAATLLPLIKT